MQFNLLRHILHNIRYEGISFHVYDMQSKLKITSSINDIEGTVCLYFAEEKILGI